MLHLKKYIELYAFFLKNEKNYSYYTIVSYRNDLIQFFNYLKLYRILKDDKIEDVDRSVMRKYIVYLKKSDYSARSISRKISTVRSFFKFCLEKA